LRPLGTVLANETRETWTQETLFAHLAHADAAMIFMPDRVDAAFLSAAPKLKVIGGALKGADNVDLAACKARGVWVSNVPGALTVPTAELAVGLLLALTRHIVRGDAVVRAPGYSGWRPILYGLGLAGSTIGIYGFGAVGQTIAQRLSGFDARVLYHDPQRLNPEREQALKAEYRPFGELLAASDHVILAAPLVPATFHAIDDAALKMLRHGATLTNIGRGSVADEAAVARALASGALAGYAADVFEMEDLSIAERPRAIPPALLAFPEKTVFTPHLGSAIENVRLQIALEAAANIGDALRGGRPRNAL
jgi:phosphonate dehydrogenase